MTARRGYHFARVLGADWLLIAGSMLLFAASFLRWQAGTNAWGGDGGFAGALMALFALLVTITTIIAGLGVVSVPAGIRTSTVVVGLAIGLMLFGLIKFLFAAVNHPKPGAWIGLVLLGLVALGSYVKVRTERMVPPASGFGP